MSEGAPSDRLHLPSLSIKGFRGIDDLSVPRLGRVTLLAGRNGIGKTTILEACRVYAARGRHSVLLELTRGHVEYSAVIEEDGESRFTPDLGALFYGRDPLLNGVIEIGPENGSTENHLRIEIVRPDKEYLAMLEERIGIDPEGDLRVIKASFQGLEHIIPLKRNPNRPALHWQRGTGQAEPPPTIECVSLGPGLMSNDTAATFWDSVTMESGEVHVVEALRLVLGNAVESVVMVGDTGRQTRMPGRRAAVKLRGHDRRVPLKSLGDGATRFFGIALALANSSNGFLFIDEAENGIHYSVQRDFWHMVLKTAHENNVQVLATTHGWDCIRGFAQAAAEIGDTEGTLVRLEKENERIRAIEYSESELETASEQSIEVR